MLSLGLSINGLAMYSFMSLMLGKMTLAFGGLAEIVKICRLRPEARGDSQTKVWCVVCGCGVAFVVSVAWCLWWRWCLWCIACGVVSVVRCLGCGVCGGMSVMWNLWSGDCGGVSEVWCPWCGVCLVAPVVLCAVVCRAGREQCKTCREFDYAHPCAQYTRKTRRKAGR